MGNCCSEMLPTASAVGRASSTPDGMGAAGPDAAAALAAEAAAASVTAMSVASTREASARLCERAVGVRGVVARVVTLVVIVGRVVVEPRGVVAAVPRSVFGADAVPLRDALGGRIPVVTRGVGPVPLGIAGERIAAVTRGVGPVLLGTVAERLGFGDRGRLLVVALGRGDGCGVGATPFVTTTVCVFTTVLSLSATLSAGGGISSVLGTASVLVYDLESGSVAVVGLALFADRVVVTVSVSPPSSGSAVDPFDFAGRVLVVVTVSVSPPSSGSAVNPFGFAG